MSETEAARLLGTDQANADKILPLIEDAAAAIAQVTVPGEAEIHEVVAGAYRYESAKHDSDDTERRLKEAFRNVSKWRDSSQVYLNGAAILLRRALPALSRFEAKKRVLAAFRRLHPGKASERFYFTREKGVDAPKGSLAAGDRAALDRLVREAPDKLTDEQLGLAVRSLARPEPGSDAVEALARVGDRVAPRVLEALAQPEEAAASVTGEASELMIAVRRLAPKLSPAVCERIVRAALEAGWTEWVDRPLLEAPFEPTLRQRLLDEFGTRQNPRGNPYRPTELWFYNLDPS